MHQRHADHARREMNMTEFNAGGGPGVKFAADWYSYTATVASIASGAVATATINIQADAAFSWEKAMVQANITGVTEPAVDNIIIPVTALITDTGTGRQLMNAATPVNSIFGKGNLPFILPVPRIFKPLSTITITLANYGGSTYLNLYLVLSGRKLFKYNEGM